MTERKRKTKVTMTVYLNDDAADIIALLRSDLPMYGSDAVALWIDGREQWTVNDVPVAFPEDDASAEAPKADSED